MDDGSFQWDDAKAIANKAKHNVSFESARDVFDDPFALEWLDEGQSANEQRFVALGMSEGRLLFVAYATRGDSVRVLSARLAEPFERRRYHNENKA